MTKDEEKDPPVPAYLEGITLQRVDSEQLPEENSNGDESSPANGQDE